MSKCKKEKSNFKAFKMDGQQHLATHFGVDDKNPINYDGCEGRANMNHLIYDELSMELQND